MFDIGFAELVIIGVVALIVIGPERLPEAIRTASAWLNRLRRGFNDIKQEVQQELHNDAVLREIRESGEKLRREAETLKNDLRGPLEDTDAELRADAGRQLEKKKDAGPQPEKQPEKTKDGGDEAEP